MGTNAYLSLVAGFCVSPRLKALVSFYGYGDITGVWCNKPSAFYCEQPLVSIEDAYDAVGNSILSEGESNRKQFYLYCRQQGILPKEASGYDPATDSARFLQLSPIHNISDEFPPTLFIHGDKDTDVPYQQSVKMAKKLDSVGVENKLIIVPDAGHIFDEDMQNPIISNAFDDVLLFLKKYLKIDRHEN